MKDEKAKNFNFIVDCIFYYFWIYWKNIRFREKHREYSE